VIKTIHPPVDKIKLLADCKKILSNYPVECPERIKVKKQIEDLEKSLAQSSVVV
jgi:hypothetical protein